MNRAHNSELMNRAHNSELMNRAHNRCHLRFGALSVSECQEEAELWQEAQVFTKKLADDGNEGKREGRGREGRRRESWEREGGQEDMKERVLGVGGRALRREFWEREGGQKKRLLGEEGRRKEF
ncbi:unnamed protein product [Arctogadus glacialis]